MANEKRLEELRHAHTKLELLVKSLVLVNMDSTAREILDEVLACQGTSAASLQDFVTVAFAHAIARIEVESRRVAREQVPA